MSTELFSITAGTFALELVDKLAVGYLPEWQAPGGIKLPTLDITAYPTTGTSGFGCQLVSGVLESTENVTTTTIDPPICADTPPAPVITQSEDTFTLVLDMYQDPTLAAGLSRYLYEHRGKPAYLWFSQGDPEGEPPIIVGVVKLRPGQIGGGRTPNRATPTFTFEKPPDIQFGSDADYAVIFGDKSTPVELPLLVAAGAGPADDADAS